MFEKKIKKNMRVRCSAKKRTSAVLADRRKWDPQAGKLRGSWLFRTVGSWLIDVEVAVDSFRGIRADEAEAIGPANDSTYGLSGVVWTGDQDRAQRVARALRMGTVWINDFNVYFATEPIGWFGV